MKDDKISLVAAILMNMNMMVGAGIFLNPMFMAKEAGCLSFLGWPLIGIVFLPVVLGIAQVAKMFPGEGSFYTYNAGSLGKFGGFLSGWLYFLGYVAVGTTHLIALKKIATYELGINLFNDYSFIFNFIVISLLVFLSMFSLRIVSAIQNSATIFKLIPLIVVGALFAFYYSSSAICFQNQTIDSLFSTIPYALFGFWGFEACASISHKIRGSAAKAMLIGFFGTVIIYTIFHLGLIQIMGASNLATLGVRAFVDFLNLPYPIISKMLAALIKSAITIAHISVCFGSFIACSFLLHSMAVKKLLFSSNLLKKSNKDGQPVAALIFQGILMFAFALFATNIGVVTCISNMGILLAFVLTFVSLVMLNLKNKYFTQLAIPLLAFGSCGLILYYTFKELGSIYNTIPFLAIIGFGIMLFSLKSDE